MQSERFVSPPTCSPECRAVEAFSARSLCKHSHSEYGFGYLITGGQRSASGRGEVVASPGDIITVNPEEVHDGHAVAHTARHWRMVYLQPSYVRSLFGDADGRQIEFQYPVVADRTLLPTMHRVYHLATSLQAHVDASEFDETLLMALSPLVSIGEPAARICRNAKRLRMAKEFIDADSASELSLEILERLTDLSRFQLIRGFVALTGLTSHNYIVQQRLNAAMGLIRRGTNLADAALQSGFADQSHFNRQFKRRYGLTPGVYARQGNVTR